jgi:hypothetical protein
MGLSWIWIGDLSVDSLYTKYELVETQSLNRDHGQGDSVYTNRKENIDNIHVRVMDQQRPLRMGGGKCYPTTMVGLSARLTAVPFEIPKF